MKNFENSMEKWLDQILGKIPAIIMGLVILIIGIYLIRLANKIILRRFERRHINLSIQTFVSSLIRFVLYVLLILTVANTMGIQTTSFIAALSAFGLAVGLALQGSLSNFAGGILILLFRPFEVGDYINSANGSNGTVERIDLLYSTLIDDEGIRVFSPNGTLANSVIKNYTKVSSRRMQFSFQISYSTNIKEAREIILDACRANKRVLKTPDAKVYVSDLKDTGITLVVHAWTKREHFGDVKNEVAEQIQGLIDGTNTPQLSIKTPNDQV